MCVSNPFWVEQQAANGGLLHGPVVGGVRNKCTEPATVVGLRHGGAERLRRSAIFISGMHKMCRQPETVVNFQHGGAKSLRRPGIFVRGGAQSLRLSAIFSMGLHRA